MANVAIRMTADASSLISEMKRAGVSVEGFEDSAKKAEKSTGTWQTSAKALGMELLGGLGIVLVVQKIWEFVKASEAAARQQKDAFGALTTSVQGITSFSEAMSAAQAVTMGMVSETKLASSLSVIYGAGLASNAEEAARLASAGTILTGVFASAGASQELFVRLLSSGSQELFNNFGLTKALVDEKQREVEATTELSGAEARQQAVKQALLDTADKYQGALSEETIASARAAAAYEDMTAELGQSLLPAFTLAHQQSALFFGEIADGVEGFNLMADVLGRLTDSTNQHTEVEKSWIRTRLEGALVGRLVLGNQEEISAALTNAAHWLVQNTVGWDALAESYGAGAEQSAELTAALAEQEAGYQDTAAAIAFTAEQLTDLYMTQADYINDIGQLEQDRRDTFADISADMVKINTTSAEKIKETESDKQEALNRLFERFQQDRNRAISSGHTERLGEIERAYNEEKTKTIEHYDTLAAETKAGAEKRRQKLIAQQAAEQAEFDKHVAELKLKAALGVAETTGQLEALTGGVTSSASEAFALIQAGVIPVTTDFQTAITAYTQQLSQASSDYKSTQEANTRAIDAALSGTTALTQDQIQAMGYELPKAGSNTKNALVRDFNEAASAVGRASSQADGLTQSLAQTEAQARRTAAAVQSVGVGSSGRIPGYASGGDFVVPPGFPNDSYLMGVTSGERVQVTNNYNQQSYNLSVSGAMPSAGIERDFRLLQAAG